jgi:ABC-type phosphate transport system substrate-binding protein
MQGSQVDFAASDVAFRDRGRVKAPCGPTEFYPVSGPGWHSKAENGSFNVVTYVTSSRGDGTIGYDEYAYALAAGVPVARLRNTAGHVAVPPLSKCDKLPG